MTYADKQNHVAYYIKQSKGIYKVQKFIKVYKKCCIFSPVLPNHKSFAKQTKVSHNFLATFELFVFDFIIMK